MISLVITKDELSPELRKVAKRASNFKLVMDAFSTYQVGSVIQTFKDQGRPEKWKPLKPKTIIARFTRGNRGKKIKKSIKSSRFTSFFLKARILIDRGRLWTSILPKSERFKSIVGTNVIYAATHDRGDKKRKIPARPFLFFLKEDMAKFEEMIFAWISRGRIIK